MKVTLVASNMSKDFSEWHKLKSRIHESHQSPLFREREVWWCSLGANIGFEEDGKHGRFERPVLVVRKFNREMLWVLPLSSKIKDGIYYHHFLLNGELRSVLLSQIRTVSAKRLIRRVAKLNQGEFAQILESLIGLYNTTDPLRGPRVPDGNL